MKKLLVTLTSAFLLISCMTVKQAMPVKGQYFEPPFKVTTQKSFDQVWDKLIDVFAQKGLPIKIIDRTSGLIISDRTIIPATNEKRDLTLKDPSAFIVVPIQWDYMIKKYKVEANNTDYSGEWNVRIKTEDGQTSININIVNVQYSSLADKISAATFVSSARSTGNFERTLSDLIK